MIISDYGRWYVDESGMRVAQAKKDINSHKSSDEECQLGKAHACNKSCATKMASSFAM